MRRSTDSLLSGLVVLSALAIGVSAVHREFFSQPAAAPARDITFVKAWHDLLPVGIDIGNPQARIKIVEFTDLECPYCRALNTSLQELTAERGNDIDVVFVHYPLPIHRFAVAAAHVAECAASHGRFQQMVEALFTKQDSLGLRGWGSYAIDAGIADTNAIAACARDTHPVKRIEDGIALGTKMRVTGTPTVLVNGWRFTTTPTKAQLVEVIDSLESGRRPRVDPGGTDE